MSLVGFNQPCPCGSGAKYKKCCRGTVDWENIIKKGNASDAVQSLTVRGRNLGFLNQIDSLLGLSGREVHWGQVKEAMSPRVVRDIAEAVTVYWPKTTDIAVVLKQADQSRISALHLGTQQNPEQILRAVARQALYADKILIFDPIVHPLNVRPEYSALHNPDEHVFNTLKHLRTWYALSPWIESGIVEIIRGPGDFDHKLRWDLLTDANSKRISNFDEAIKHDIAELSGSSESNDLKMLHVLGLSDQQLAHMYLSSSFGTSSVEVADFIKFIRSEEKKHPYFIDVATNGQRVSQLTSTTSGACYAEGSMVANISNAYLFTDLRSRWIEIQNERVLTAPARIWDPFSKAFSEAEIPTFQNIPLPFVLKMRTEGRMETMRTFLRRVWKAGQTSDYDEREAVMFADEFKHELQIARSEWAKMDSDLIKWVGAEGLIATLAAVFSTGEIIPAAGWALAAAVQTTSSTLNRHNFKKRYPAAMFLNLEKSNRSA